MGQRTGSSDCAEAARSGKGMKFRVWRETRVKLVFGGQVDAEPPKMILTVSMFPVRTLSVSFGIAILALP